MSLLKGGNELYANIEEKIVSSTKKVLLQSIEFKESTDADNEEKNIYSKYKPLNAAYNSHKSTQNNKEANKIQRQTSCEKENAFLSPKVVIFPPDKIEMNWKEPKRIGPGFANLGNTCFLNSVLQVLTYTAPLVNVANSDTHRNSCVSVGFCMLCEFRNHLVRIAKHHPQNGPIRPMTIIQRLSCISKNFKFGRQEDAHEFLRYVIEAFRKSCLAGKKNLDRFSKETTAMNQIFGGFFRSQVTCLSCKKASNTFDPMMELNLDIKESSTIVDAMKKTVRTEKLDGDNKYSCERCKKKTIALKKGNIHTPPKILTLQLKRFDFQRLFGGKISKEVHFQETLDLSPFLSQKPATPVLYKLYAVLVHSGFSCNSGHYYCYVKAPNGIWYEMNDSRVSQVGLQTVLRAQAYLLFYSIIGHKPPKTSIQTVQNHVKALNIKAASNGNQKKDSAVKDIGLPVFKQEPRIVPFSKGDKIKFSFSSTSKLKSENNIKEISKPNGTPSSKHIGSEGSSKLSRKSSLEAIRKDYDSSESEENEENAPSSEKTSDLGLKQPTNVTGKEVDEHKTEKEVITKAKGVPGKRVNEDEKSLPGGSNLPKAESKSKENEVKDPLPKDTTLSPPKSVNTDVIHKKKQLKTPNATAIGASKFGRWVPVRSLSGNFTPRPILHRSLSDSSSFEKAKTTSHKKEVKRQMSVQVDSTIQNEKVEKAKHWNIEENKRLDPPYGPMTPIAKPFISDADHFRERTSSITSDTGSISTKTGDWDVHDKDICDIPAAPYIQERHFAGWSVENHSDQKKSHCVDKEKSNENKVSRKLFEKGETKSEQRSDNKSDKKSGKRSLDDDHSNKRKRKSKKRRKSEEEKAKEDAEDLGVASKRRRQEEKESPECHKSKKKSKKSKKKKKNKRKQHDEENQNVEEEKEKMENSSKKNKKRDDEMHRKKHKKRHEEKCDEMQIAANAKDKIKDVKHRESKESKPEKVKEGETVKENKKHNKKKKKGSNAESSENSRYQKKTKADDEGDSRYSAVKTPRRVSLTTLSTANSDDKRHDGLQAAASNFKTSSKATSDDLSDAEKDSGRNPPSKKTKADAPVKQWDEKPHNSTSWNGSNDNAVLDSLLSKKSRVTTWDNEASENIRHEVSGSTKRSRDRWDDEYDQGKIKKMKKRHSHPSTNYNENPFQKFQNRRNVESNKR